MTLGHLLCLMAGYLVGGLSIYCRMRDYRTTVLVMMDPTETRALIREQVAAEQDGAEESEPFWITHENGARR